MREIHRSALVPYTATKMFRLVNDCASYPDFLPWCRAADVEVVSPTEQEVALEFARSGLHRRFTTYNRFEPGQSIRMELVDGPFRELTGQWLFHSLDHEGSKVILDLRFEFSSRLLEGVFAPIFAEVMASLVDAFVTRAGELYGGA